MPQMEGIEADEKILQKHSEPALSWVSSVGYQGKHRRALQRGARHFVQSQSKPMCSTKSLSSNGDDVAVAAIARTALRTAPRMKMELISLHQCSRRGARTEPALPHECGRSPHGEDTYQRRASRHRLDLPAISRDASSSTCPATPPIWRARSRHGNQCGRRYGQGSRP